MEKKKATKWLFRLIDEYRNREYVSPKTRCTNCNKKLKDDTVSIVIKGEYVIIDKHISFCGSCWEGVEENLLQWSHT